MAQAGEIGQLWQVKYRAAHQGPVELGCSRQFCEWLYDEELNGAGALMDYCCYGAVLAEVLLGKPDQVTGIKISTGLKPDLGFESPEGAQAPGVSVFLLRDGGVRHFYSGCAMLSEGEFRGMDLLCPFWHFLDLTPEGRGDFMPQKSYGP